MEQASAMGRERRRSLNGKTLSNSITAVVALDYQGSRQEKPVQANGKSDSYHQKAAMRHSEIYVKNSPPPEIWWQRSQGGVRLPTGGNCAQCA
jgi:hypothetical protein